jgi:hypothetical protein
LYDLGPTKWTVAVDSDGLSVPCWNGHKCLAGGRGCQSAFRPSRLDADQQLPTGGFWPGQVIVHDHVRWTELKYSCCFHLSSFKYCPAFMVTCSVQRKADNLKPEFEGVRCIRLASVRQLIEPTPTQDHWHALFRPRCSGFCLLRR